MSPGVLSGLAAGLVFLSFAASTPSMAKAPPSPPGPARPASQKVAIRPVPEAPGHYLLQQNRADTLFTGTGLSLRLTPPERPVRELHWGVVGARAMTPQPLEPRETRFHQLVGAPENWKRNLPTWGALYYPQVSPGVDLWFEAQEAGVTYSLRAERGADLRQVRLEWRGAQALRLAGGGRALEVVLADGVMREEGLLCGQEAADGTSFEVPCRYREVRQRGAELWEYVIEVDVKEPGRPAWVDPTLSWNTFLGGSGNELLRALATLDTELGDSFVVGSTTSDTVEPGSARYFPHGVGGSSDVVVTRFNNRGGVVWTAVIGGSMNDFGTAIAIGVDNFIYIAGNTSSNDFPRGTSPDPNWKPLPFQVVPDGFVARLSSDGATLDWVQLLGGGGQEEIQSLTLAPWKGQGTESTLKLYAAGWTTSSLLPPVDAGTSKADRDLFVSRIDYLTGAVEKTLIRSGGGNEEASGIRAASSPTADGGTHLYVTGYTTSADYPVASGAAPSDTAGGTALVFKLDHELAASPLWEEFLGGQGEDRSSGLVLSSPSRLMIVGTTRAQGFPNPDNRTPVGADAFLASFDTLTGQRVSSTLVGGDGDDEGLTLAPGTFGSVYIGGRTTSPALPSIDGGISPADYGPNEGFVIRMGQAEADKFVPEWGTFVGGAQRDVVRALATGITYPVLVVAGGTSSTELPRPPWVSTGAKRYHSGGDDIFLFSMRAYDFTPPRGGVRDGRLATDQDETQSTTELEANWTFSDSETEIRQFDVSVGTAPGCNDVKGFSMVGDGGTTSVALSSTRQEIPTLTPGRWYFVNVRATNSEDLSATVPSNGIFVLLPDGGPTDIPPRPDAGTECPGGGPGSDGGTDGGDAGEPAGPDGGDENPGPGESPLGFSCGTPGGPTGLVLLVVVAFALLSARRNAWN